jgi:hypothetical protein
LCAATCCKTSKFVIMEVLCVTSCSKTIGFMCCILQQTCIKTCHHKVLCAIVWTKHQVLCVATCNKVALKFIIVKVLCVITYSKTSSLMCCNLHQNIKFIIQEVFYVVACNRTLELSWSSWWWLCVITYSETL